MNELNLCLIARDRPILTQKTIQSIKENSPLFNKIHIYLFDNLSAPTPERLAIFSKLLMDKTIEYYSYDTSESLIGCFGKMIAYKEFYDKMILRLQLLKRNNLRTNLDSYFAICDNDMIFNKYWDSYFISASNYIDTVEKTIHICVVEPGGVPTSGREQARRYTTISRSNGKVMNLLTGNWGGGSGFWFSNANQFAKIAPQVEDIAKTMGIFKRHDTTMWNRFQENTRKNNYVTTISPDPSDWPLIIHMGGIVGSMCNSLMKKEYNDETQDQFMIREEQLLNMEPSEMIQKYKDKTSRW